LLGGVVGTGCFVTGEIDKGMAEYDAHRPGAKDSADAARAARGEPPAPAPGTGGGSGAAAAAGSDGKPAVPSGPSWWQTARTLGSERMNEDIIGCRHGTKLEFMLKDDCLARGGTPE
jgi:hypothetical protein